MLDTLSPIFEKLEYQRQELSGWVEHAPAEKQYFQPEPGKWSAVQVLFHLAFIEEQVLKFVERKLNAPTSLQSKSLKTILRGTLLTLFLRLPLKFKAPKVVSEIPEDVKLAEVLARWQNARAQLKQILQNFPGELLQKEIFRHPISGMLTMQQTLEFLYQHHSHHIPQLQRLLK